MHGFDYEVCVYKNNSSAKRVVFDANFATITVFCLSKEFTSLMGVLCLMGLSVGL